MTFKSRLETALRLAGKERRDLYGPVGLTVQAVTNVMRGKTAMFCAEHVIKTARFLNVNPLWLATGEGPVWELMPGEYRELVQQLGQLPTRRRQEAIKLCQQIAVLFASNEPQELEQLIELLQISSKHNRSTDSQAASQHYHKPKTDGRAG